VVDLLAEQFDEHFVRDAEFFGREADQLPRRSMSPADSSGGSFARNAAA